MSLRATGGLLAFSMALGAAALTSDCATGAEVPTPPPGLDGVKAGSKAPSQGEVRTLQDALIWTDNYSGAVSGNLGPRTRDAIAGFLKRTGSPETGSLDAAARARLFAEAKAKKQAVGFAPVSDKRAGFAFSLPMKLLPKVTGTDSGTRFASADGAIVVDTLARPAANGALPEVFARMSATAGQRRVTYQLLRPDFFVVSGEIGARSFYSRFAAGKADGADVVRGFTMSYPKAAAARLDAVTLAVAASFDPFPAAAKPIPVAENVEQRGGSATRPPAFAEAVLVGSGLALSRVSRLTCPAPRIDGVPVSYGLEDEPTGLALLNLRGGAGAPVPVAAEPVAERETLFALFHGVPDRDGKPGPLLAAPTQVRQAGVDRAGFAVSAPFQASSAAPPLFDRSGALVGVAEIRKALPAVAGTVPEADYRVTGVAGIAAFLNRAGVTRRDAAQPGVLGLGEVATAVGPSIMSVACDSDNAVVP